MSLSPPPAVAPGHTTARSAAGSESGSDVSLSDIQPWLILTLSCVLATLVARHYDGLNGPAYWKWPWRNHENLSLVPLVGALVPFGFAQWGFTRERLPRWSVLLLLMVTTAALETIVASARPSSGSNPVAEAVWDPLITSYFTDAASISDVVSWIRTYADRMPSFHLHSMNKPPLPILFYLPFIKVFGNNLRAALVGGYAVGGLATLSIPAVYTVIKKLARSTDVAFCAASFFALTPSLVLFMPEFDQLFPILSCPLITIWASALDTDRIMPPLVMGLLLAAITLVSFNLLVLGVFLALQTLIALSNPAHDAQFERTLRQATTVFLTFLIAHTILWGVFGYRALAVFKMALVLQQGLLHQIPRPYPQTVLFDLTDFALGSGWITVVLVALYLLRHRRRNLETETALVGAGLLQIIILAVLGVLPGETARVWLFMLPLLMLPVGLELARWTFSARMLVYGSVWLITFMIGRHTQFL